METVSFIQVMLDHHDATCPFGSLCGVRTLHAMATESIDTKEKPCPTSP